MGYLGEGNRRAGLHLGADPNSPSASGGALLGRPSWLRAWRSLPSPLHLLLRHGGSVEDGLGPRGDLGLGPAAAAAAHIRRAVDAFSRPSLPEAESLAGPSPDPGRAFAQRLVAASAASWPSVLLMLPPESLAAAAGEPRRPLVTTGPVPPFGNGSVTPTAVFSAADLGALLRSGAAPSGSGGGGGGEGAAGMWEQLVSRYDVLGHPPGVETLCLFGVGIPTATQVHLEFGLGDFGQIPYFGGPGASPALPLGDGDGTVSREGLELPCAAWGGRRVALEGVGHAAIMAHGGALGAFLDEVFSRTGPGST